MVIVTVTIMLLFRLLQNMIISILQNNLSVYVLKLHFKIFSELTLLSFNILVICCFLFLYIFFQIALNFVVFWSILIHVLV